MLTAAYKSAVPQEGLAVYSLRGGHVLYHLVEEVQGKKCILDSLESQPGRMRVRRTSNCPRPSVY